MIAIVDYGVGNLFSLKSSFSMIGQAAAVTGDPAVLREAERLILPGVGAFADAAGKLRDSGLADAVMDEARRGKYVLGISRSEAASNIFINACNEFQFLESVGKRNVEKPKRQKTSAVTEEAADESELNKLLTTVLEEQDQDEIYASELKETLLRLRPDFNEKAYGCATFFKLLTKLANRFGDLRVHNDNFNVMVGLNSAGDNGETIPQLTRDNWKEAFAAQIRAYKEGGFDRVNPSILKADIITAYPDFTERAIGFKRFSDVMKQLEKDGLVIVEMDEQKTMLIKLL